MGQAKNPSVQDDEQRGALGTGELHILSTNKDDILVSADELGEALGREEELDIEELTSDRRFRTRRLPEYIDILKQANLSADVRLHVHRLRRAVKRTPSLADLEGGLEGVYERKYHQVCLGKFQLRGSRVFFNGVELCAEALEKWLKVCLHAVWNDDSFNSERATELARLIGTHLREAELRSLGTLRRTLGDDAAEQLVRDGKVTVRTPSGEEYVITDSARVYRRSPSGRLRHVCVGVRGEEDLPKYDRVLAKYLVIRDHPEQIDTLRDRRALEREREMLSREIERLHERLSELEHRRMQMRAGEA